MLMPTKEDAMSKPSKFLIVAGLVLAFVLVLAACAPGAAPPEPEAPQAEQAEPEEAPAEPEPTQPPPPTDTPEPTPTPAPPTETPLPTETPTPEVQLSGLSADPQRVEFQAEDGKNLVGYYYPAKYADAPVVVLMHWAGGDQRDWCRIAPWMQNRLDENPAEMPGCPEPPGPLPHWDPTWFPPMPEDTSYAVFTFDFRDFGESEAGVGTPSNFGLDGVAAYKTAAEMPRSAAYQNSGKVAKSALVVGELPLTLGIGSSIGADVVSWACYQYNLSLDTPKCVGAVSLSPGSYIGNNYAQDVKNLYESDPLVPVWCLAGEGDYSANTCRSAEEHLEGMVIYAGTGAHGTLMVDPDELFDPNALIYIQGAAVQVFPPKP